MTTPIVQTKNLSKIYQSGEVPVHALDNINFTVQPGSFTAIIGKSGCGKSTLLHLLGGLDRPTAGEIIVDGNELHSMNRTQLALFRRRRVGFIFQQFNLIPDLTVYDNVIFPLALDGTSSDEAFIMHLLEKLHIADKRTMMPAQLSGGEQQRVAIARALAIRPALILADEPTGSLDTKTRHEVLGLMKVLSEQLRQTLVVVTHDLDIAQLADRIVEMRDGRIVEGGDHDAGK